MYAFSQAIAIGDEGKAPGRGFSCILSVGLGLISKRWESVLLSPVQYTRSLLSVRREAADISRFLDARGPSAGADLPGVLESYRRNPP